MSEAEDKRFDRLETKLDKAEEKIGEINVSLVDIKADLRAHMARTAAVERSNELLKEYIDTVKTDMVKNDKDKETRLSKLETIRSNVNFLGWVALGILGILETMRRLGWI